MINIKTERGLWSTFTKQIAAFLECDLIQINIDGTKVRGYRSPDSQCLWIRDHADMLRGGRYYMKDVKSAVECFANSQFINGRIFDNVTTTPEIRTGENENWEKWVRVPVEADVEYRFVKAAFLAWQATGDRDWIEKLLPSLNKALVYTMSHPWRWDQEHQLIKRPYTIDTWDFDYTAGKKPWLNFDISEDTFWGIFHGDNSGFYEAAIQLSRLYSITDQQEQELKWKEIAMGVKQRANNLLFNGKFYTHFYKLTSVTIDGVDESQQLSLSNPMAVNRGMAKHDMAVTLIKEYQSRKQKTNAFAEWFGIDPPFPDGIFGDEKLVSGAYINGGIFPLAGGELALAALEHGFEAYGVETLRKYREMIASTGESYLWYFPDGNPSTAETSTSPDALPTDGWGSSAMLYAFLEGLCGIKDLGHSFEKVDFSPRWVADGQTKVSVKVGYEASGAYFSYYFEHNLSKQEIKLALETANALVNLHLLLPEKCEAAEVFLNGVSIDFQNTQIEQSSYVDVEGLNGKSSKIIVHYVKDSDQ